MSMERNLKMSHISEKPEEEDGMSNSLSIE